MEIKKRYGYEVSSFHFLNTTMTDYLEFEIILDCPIPYLESIDNYGRNIASITNQFAFPLVMTKKHGKIMGYKTYKNEVQIINDGDIQTGVEIILTAQRGTVLNPKVSLGDKYIEVLLEMKKNDVLAISTKSRNKSIKLNGENVINKINRNSNFFQLEAGDNVVRYDAKDGYIHLDVNLYFNKKYLGV